MPHHDGEHTAGVRECFSLKDKCFSKVSTDRRTHPTYSCKLKLSTDYVLRLLQRINGAYGFTWTHVVSMGDSQGEMKILEPDPKTFHCDDIILGDDADNMHQQMSEGSLTN